MVSHNNLTSGNCPICHAPITVGRASLDKKVRCPKCRKLITLGISTEQPATRAAAGSAEIIAPLSSETRPAVTHGSEVAAVIPSAAVNGGDHRHSTKAQASYLDEIQIETLMRHLHCENEDRQIAIRVTESDPDALTFARFLNELFSKAGWRTTEVVPVQPGLRRGESIALHAGPWPFPEEVTKTCMALTAAGVAFTSHMAPNQIRERAVLVISGKPTFRSS